MPRTTCPDCGHTDISLPMAPPGDQVDRLACVCTECGTEYAHQIND